MPHLPAKNESRGGLSTSRQMRWRKQLKPHYKYKKSTIPTAEIPPPTAPLTSPKTTPRAPPQAKLLPDERRRHPQKISRTRHPLLGLKTPPHKAAYRMGKFMECQLRFLTATIKTRTTSRFGCLGEEPGRTCSQHFWGAEWRWFVDEERLRRGWVGGKSH